MKSYIESIKASPNVPDVAPEVILIIQAKSRLVKALEVMAKRIEGEGEG